VLSVIYPAFLLRSSDDVSKRFLLTANSHSQAAHLLQSWSSKL